MKKVCVVSALPIAVAIGTAMGVAMKNNAGGFAIGLGVFVMLNFFGKRKAQ